MTCCSIFFWYFWLKCLKKQHLWSLAGFALRLRLGHLGFLLTLLITFSVPVKGNKLHWRCSITSCSDVSILSHTGYRQFFLFAHLVAFQNGLQVWRPHKFLAGRQNTQSKQKPTLAELYSRSKFRWEIVCAILVGVFLSQLQGFCSPPLTWPLRARSECHGVLLFVICTFSVTLIHLCTSCQGESDTQTKKNKKNVPLDLYMMTSNPHDTDGELGHNFKAGQTIHPLLTASIKHSSGI